MWSAFELLSLVAVAVTALGARGAEGAHARDADGPAIAEAPASGDAPAPELAPDEADEADEADDDNPPDVPDGEDEDDAAEQATGPDGGKAHRPHGGCPSSMVRAGAFCIDRYEAPNRRGASPLVMQSALDANAWCAERQKRMCTEDEWIAACQGDERRAYPYGNDHVDGRCNDDKVWRKVDEGVLARWPAPEAKEHARELYQATPSGSKRGCTTEYGARDMTGNVEEWVVRTREHANAYPYLLIGCYWSGCYGGNKPTCHSTNNAHGPDFRFYETGFRCCKDARK